MDRNIYIYIYMCSWFLGQYAAPLFGIYELISGPRRVNQRPPLPKALIMRNGGAAFCGKSIIVSRWWNRDFCQKAILEDLLRVLILAWQNPYFVFHLWRFGSWRRIQRGRKTRKRFNTRGFGAISRLLRLQLPLDGLDRLDFAEFFGNNFCGSYKSVFFFGSSNFWTKLGWRAKKGLQN